MELSVSHHLTCVCNIPVDPAGGARPSQMSQGTNCSKSEIWIRIIQIWKSHDHVIHLTLVLVFHSKIRLYHPYPDTHFFGSPNLHYQLQIGFHPQCRLLVKNNRYKSMWVTFKRKKQHKQTNIAFHFQFSFSSQTPMETLKGHVMGNI